jgi:hypothetical protein
MHIHRISRDESLIHLIYDLILESIDRKDAMLTNEQMGELNHNMAYFSRSD